MATDLPTTKKTPLEPGGDSPLDRYEAGEIDIHTLVLLVPESSLPTFIAAQYAALKSILTPDQQSETSEAKRKSADRLADFIQMVGQWRMDRGPGYVEAYVEFKKTGEAIDAGKRVVESDWFIALQRERESEIARLEKKAMNGQLTPEEKEKWSKLANAQAGDEQVATDWKALSDDHQKLKAREQSRNMPEEELRKEEAELKQRMFEQLDRASPELREKLLQEISAANPSFRSEYAAHAQAHGAAPGVAQNSADLAKIKNPAAFADPDMQELVSDLTVMERESSTAKRHGFAGVEASVVAHDHFAAAVASPTLKDSPVLEQTLSRTVRGPNRDPA